MALNVSPADACQAKTGLKRIAVGRLYRAVATFRCSIEPHAYLSTTMAVHERAEPTG